MDKSNFWKTEMVIINQYNQAKFAIYNYNEERISGVLYDRKLLDDIVRRHNEIILVYVLGV